MGTPVCLSPTALRPDTYPHAERHKRRVDGGFRHTVFMISGILIGLHQHPGTDADDTFAELSIGLDHIAFACADRADLTSLNLTRLTSTHGGIVDAHYGSGLSSRDSDGIALEFFAPQVDSEDQAATARRPLNE